MASMSMSDFQLETKNEEVRELQRLFDRNDHDVETRERAMQKQFFHRDRVVPISKEEALKLQKEQPKNEEFLRKEKTLKQITTDIARLEKRVEKELENEEVFREKLELKMTCDEKV